MLIERCPRWSECAAASRQQDCAGFLLFHLRSDRLSGDECASDVHGEIIVEAVARLFGEGRLAHRCSVVVQDVDWAMLLLDFSDQFRDAFGSLASTLRALALYPFDISLSASSCVLAMLRAAKTTWKPSFAKRSAVAKPIPGPAPMLRNVFISCSLSCACDVTFTACAVANRSEFHRSSSERGGEGGLGGIAERGCDRHDRYVGVAQHVHGLLEPVLAQPGMRRQPGAFLEGTAEVEA